MLPTQLKLSELCGCGHCQNCPGKQPCRPQNEEIPPDLLENKFQDIYTHMYGLLWKLNMSVQCSPWLVNAEGFWQVPTVRLPDGGARDKVPKALEHCRVINHGNRLKTVHIWRMGDLASIPCRFWVFFFAKGESTVRFSVYGHNICEITAEALDPT